MTTPTHAWSPQQSQALSSVSTWYNDKSKSCPQVFRLFGFAGTGKTTLANHFAQDHRVVYGAYTGKAALQMSKSGCEGASTIHSLTYKLDPPDPKAIRELEEILFDESTPKTRLKEVEAELRELKEPIFHLNYESPIVESDLIIIDECSMVDEEMGQDLLSFGKKILVLGDPFQLPPVQGTGYFTHHKPEALLTEIHRQAAENPIIAMSMEIREKGILPQWRHGKARVGGPLDITNENLQKYSQILCGMNRTRFKFTDRYRRLLGYNSAYPVVGERLIALRNYRDEGIFNGLFATVEEVAPEVNSSFGLRATLLDEQDHRHENLQLLAPRFVEGSNPALLKRVPWQIEQGRKDFYFGHVITTHKAQGSQFDHVLVLDDNLYGWRSDMRDTRLRWLYTSVTRAIDSVTIVRV